MNDSEIICNFEVRSQHLVHSIIHKGTQNKQCPRSSTFRKDETVGFATKGTLSFLL